MSSINSVINVNVPKDVKDSANELFNSLGLNMSSAINMFLKKAILERGIPFEVSLKPSRDFQLALKELKEFEKNPNNKDFKRYNDVDEMLEDIIDEK